MDILERITFLNKERGWSQYRLAKEANLPPSTIENLYTRKTLPTIPTLEAICKAHEISLSDFFIETEHTSALEEAERHRLLSYYDVLTHDQQQAILKLLKSMSPQEANS